MKKGIIKKLVATVLTLITFIAIIPGATINSKASDKDYSGYIFEDGYYMTYDELVDWAKATGMEYKLVDCGTYKVLDLSFTDKKNNKWNQKIYSGAVGFFNGGSKADKSFNDVLMEVSFNSPYIYNAIARLEKVEKLNEYFVVFSSLRGAYDGYNSAKIHYEYYFTKNENGKIYTNQKPEMVVEKMLYKNNTTKFKEGKTYEVESNRFYYSDGNPATYTYTATKFDDYGLDFWAVVVEK